MSEAQVLYLAAGALPYVKIAPASSFYQRLVMDGVTLAMEIAIVPCSNKNDDILHQLKFRGVATSPSRHAGLSYPDFGIGTLLDYYEEIRPSLYAVVIDIVPGYRPSMVYGDLKKHVIRYPYKGEHKNELFSLGAYEDGVTSLVMGVFGPYIVTDMGYFNWMELTQGGGVIEVMGDS
ncbi:hypothetical protein [Alteromonas sp. 14N.309.X.WAT.G.H12]|uniref:hypothetical protein n=1 Tax=Alteromonas sp. 14N.309.X.WAT.G.H12 TaxID=3120824 RepID=UPI002FCE79E3